MNGSDKHSILLQYGDYYCRKKFYSSGPWRACGVGYLPTLEGWLHTLIFKFGTRLVRQARGKRFTYFTTLAVGVNVIKIPSLLTLRVNKLECLSMASLFRIGYYLRVRPRACHTGTRTHAQGTPTRSITTQPK